MRAGEAVRWQPARPARAGLSRSLRLGIAFLAAIAAPPPAATGQALPPEPPAPTAGHEDVCGPPGPENECPPSGQEDGTAPGHCTAPGHHTEPPPGDHPFDIYDALSLPLRVLMLPPALAGYAVREGLRLAFPAGGSGGGPGGLSRTMDGWGAAPFLPSLGHRAGPGVGVRLDGLAPVRLEAAVSWRGSWRGAVLLEPPGDRRFQLGLARSRQARPHYWGLGARTGSADRTAYRLDVLEAWAMAGGRAGPLRAVLEIGAEEFRVGGAEGASVPSLREAASPAELVGLDPGRYLRAGIRAEAESRARPEPRGRELQRRSVGTAGFVTLFRGLEGTSSDFLRAGIRAGAHLPVTPYQAFALDLRSEAARGLAGRGPPFTHLPSLGGGVGGRAYTGGRFRDRTLVSGTAEWRYELWRTIHDDLRVEALLFGEGGTVAPGWEELRIADVRTSWGVGLQAADRSRLRGLAFLAFGDEGARVGVAARWPF